MAEFATPREVEDELDELGRREPPLVARLARRPGQKEERYGHRLGTGPVSPPAADGAATVDPTAMAERGRAPTGTSAATGEVSPVAVPPPPPGAPGPEGLVAQVADLRAELAALRRDVDDVRTQLGL